MRKITVQKNDANQTLIKFLDKYFENAPKSLIAKFLRKKRIKVNGKKQEPAYRLSEGDIIDIYIYDETIEKWQSSAKKRKVHNKINIPIAFENEDVIIVDKPTNMLSHAASPADYGHNVVDFIISYLIGKKEYIPRLEHTFTPAIVNRLDRNTSGLIIGAKNRESLVNLNELIDTELVEKYYLAIVEGSYQGQDTINNYLTKTDENLVYVGKGQGAKESITHIKALKTGRKYSLLELQLVTGRTHQIRATLKSLGYPIVGDPKYGNKKPANWIKNQQLIAYKLFFSKQIAVKSIQGLEVISHYEQDIVDNFNRLEEL